MPEAIAFGYGDRIEVGSGGDPLSVDKGGVTRDVEPELESSEKKGFEEDKDGKGSSLDLSPFMLEAEVLREL